MSLTTFNPLERVVFVQKVLFFAMRKASDPLTFSKVTSTWNETLFDENFETARTFYSKEEEGFLPPRVSEAVTKAHRGLEGKIEAPKFLNFDDNADRTNLARWSPRFGSVSLVFSLAVQISNFELIKTLHRAGYPAHGPCFDLPKLHDDKYGKTYGVIDYSDCEAYVACMSDALRIACSYGKYELVKFLLSTSVKCDPLHFCKGLPPVFFTTITGFESLLKQQLENKKLHKPFDKDFVNFVEKWSSDEISDEELTDSKNKLWTSNSVRTTNEKDNNKQSSLIVVPDIVKVIQFLIAHAEDNNIPLTKLFDERIDRPTDGSSSGGEGGGGSDFVFLRCVTRPELVPLCRLLIRKGIRLFGEAGRTCFDQLRYSYRESGYVSLQTLPLMKAFEFHREGDAGCLDYSERRNNKKMISYLCSKQFFDDLFASSKDVWERNSLYLKESDDEGKSTYTPSFPPTRTDFIRFFNVWFNESANRRGTVLQSICKDHNHKSLQLLFEMVDELNQMLEDDKEFSRDENNDSAGHQEGKGAKDCSRNKIFIDCTVENPEASNIPQALYGFMNGRKGGFYYKFEMVKLLFEKGTNVQVNYVEKYGSNRDFEACPTPLFLAASANELEIGEYLMEKGADRWALNAKGQYVHEFAATGYGLEEITEEEVEEFKKMLDKF